MVEPSSFYNRLATREGFNASVRHINRTLDLLAASNPKKNLADTINSFLTDKELESEEVQSAIHMLVIEKWKYASVSKNISAVTPQSSVIAQETGKWKAVDLIIGYHHPDIGFIVLNPKNPEAADLIAGFRKNELLVLYAGTQDANPASQKNAALALSCLLDLIEGRKVKAPASLLTGPYTFSAPKKASSGKTATKSSGKPVRTAKAPARVPVVARASSTMYTGPASVQAAQPVPAALPPAPVEVASVPGQSKMSPLQSVVVTNELFHNGNVEAWKRIIRSYNAKYPGLQVFIYYDGERIIDINTLFKWGKVKHGTCIQFRVSGDAIQDLAKLSRYFRQGASNQFEAFLHGSPDTVMNLF